MLIQSIAGCVGLLILILIFRMLYRRKPSCLRAVILAVFAASIVGNIVYDCIVMFPDYYIESFWGRYKFGSVSENLLAYRDDSDFKDEVLKAVVKNRTVYMDDTALYYADYFRLFSKEVIPYSVTEEEHRKYDGFADKGYYNGRFETFRIMDYVKDTENLPPELALRLKEEETPLFFLDRDSLAEADCLLIMVDENFNLFIVGCSSPDGRGE